MAKVTDIGYIIQARLGSSRLPGKALLYFGGSTVIGYLLKSLKEGGICPEQIRVATSSSRLDDVLEHYIRGLGIGVVRGSEVNVLGRYQKAAKETGFRDFVRLTGDNPVPDVKLIRYCVEKHLDANVGLTSTRKIVNREVIRYVPKGLSVDVINSDMLLKINTSLCSPYETEHVIPYFYTNFAVQVIKDYVTDNEDCSIDTIEDYARLCRVQI